MILEKTTIEREKISKELKDFKEGCFNFFQVDVPQIKYSEGVKKMYEICEGFNFLKEVITACFNLREKESFLRINLYKDRAEKGGLITYENKEYKEVFRKGYNEIEFSLCSLLSRPAMSLIFENGVVFLLSEK